MTSKNDIDTKPPTADSGDEETVSRYTQGRFLAVRWTLTCTQHASWPDAEQALVGLPAPQRAAIVDTLTGRTLASQAAYATVQAALTDQVVGVMSRQGPIGDLTSEYRFRD